MRMHDVAVVGAGPAGGVVARQLALAGHDVVLLERERFPRRKVCGACIGPAAVGLLGEVGLAGTLSESRATALHHLCLVHRGRIARLPLHGNVALSRSVFDARLVEAAIEAGADFRDGTTVTGVEVVGDAVVLSVRGATAPVRSRVIVDASGLGGLDRDRVVAPDARLGVHGTFDGTLTDLPEHELRMVVGRGGYVGLVRVEDGSLNVAAAVDREALRDGPREAVDRILAEAGETPLPPGGAPWKGTRPLTSRPDSLASARLFRIGDAAGYVEPFTGEGMGWAIAGALAVEPFVDEAARDWNDHLVTRWTDAYREGIGKGQRLCAGLSGLLRRPHALALALRMLEPMPYLATPFVRATGRIARPRVTNRSVGARS